VTDVLGWFEDYAGMHIELCMVPANLCERMGLRSRSSSNHLVNNSKTPTQFFCEGCNENTQPLVDGGTIEVIKEEVVRAIHPRNTLMHPW
jgi:hypothetical protein